jgi:environmental stress-induced protein Ves
VSWQLVRTDQVPPSPWRNGGGVTRELVAWPSAIDWTWRISVAEVAASGPFSRFDGVQRWFAVLDGRGVRLQLGGGENILTPACAPFCFDGAQAVDCRLLDGATRDLNLMVRSDRMSARMTRIEGSRQLVARGDGVIAVYAVRAPVTLACGDATLDLPAGSLAWRQVASGTPVRIEGGQALCMEIPE